ncbi:MAG: hypothetical protein IPJ06_06615 [Saprospiraceae bacterium]|nr:hypothetical protein [Saprospiraceae bacterium]
MPDRLILASFFTIGWILMMSCNKEEPVPAWVIIPEYQVMTTPDQGTALQKFTEVYAYTTSSFLGVFLFRARSLSSNMVLCSLNFSGYSSQWYKIHTGYLWLFYPYKTQSGS